MTAKTRSTSRRGWRSARDGSFYISDGYVNSRVALFNKDGEYIRHGKKGTGVANSTSRTTWRST